MKRFLILITIIMFAVSCTKSEPAAEEIKTEAKQITAADFRGAGIQVFDKAIEAPDFTLQNLDGKSVKLSDYEGKPLLLNFWAHWCGPCKSEMPAIERLYQYAKVNGFNILAVNLAEEKDVVETYIKDNNYTFPVLLDTDGMVGTMYGARSIPTTYLINSEGNVIAGKLGAYEWDSQIVKDIMTNLDSYGN